MEISIDLAFVRDILEREYQLAREEIQQLGVLPALERSQQRHDQRIAGAADAGTLACRAGCTWCCHFSVDVRAAEVFAILDFMTREFSPEERARIEAETSANSVVLGDLDEIERMRRNVKCPFLSEGRCSIYAVRPQTCRNYHATDVTGCRQSYDNPDDLDIDPDFAPWVYQAGGAHVDAFSTALRNAGYDVNVYELNSAFAAAIDDPAARQRFHAGQSPFENLAGEAAPAEFDDSDC